MAFIRNMTLQRALSGSRWLRSTNTWKICILVYACVFILCIPSVFGSDIVVLPSYFNDTCRGPKRALAADYSSRYTVYTIGIPENNCLVYTITLWLTGVVFKIIPCMLLAFLIISLLWTIKKAEKRRRALFESNSTNRARLRLRQQQQEMNGGLGGAGGGQQVPLARSDRTTTMLVVILGLFLLTELPQGAISIMTGIYVGDMREHVYPNVGDILDLLSLINSAVNFILYCAMSSKYRQVFWQVVLPRKVYVRWFLRPRAANGLFMQTQDPAVTTQVVLGGVGRRPELQALANIANNVQSVELEPDADQESSIIDLYKAANGNDGEFSLITESEPSSQSTTPKGRTRGSLLMANHPKKKMSDCNLRRQVMTRAAILAATPAIAASASMDSMARNGEEVQFSACEAANVESGPLAPDLSSPPGGSSTALKSLFNQKKQRWHISCSCLCKCACRSGSRSPLTAAIDHERSRNRVKRNSIAATNAEVVLASKDLVIPDVCNEAVESDLRRPLCPSFPIWRRCSRSSQAKEYVFV